MNFQVPQFIEIEDKIFGPLTFKQFIYIAGSAGLAFICYALLPLWLAFIPIVIIVSFGLALAFYQVNDRPFIFTLESLLRYLIASKLYIWKKSTIDKKRTLDTSSAATPPSLPRLSESKLKDLAWSLDIKERIK